MGLLPRNMGSSLQCPVQPYEIKNGLLDAAFVFTNHDPSHVRSRFIKNQHDVNVPIRFIVGG